MKYDKIAALLSLVIVLVAGIACFGVVKLKEVESMERSIEIGASKGIDPIAVRCAYAHSTDAVCVVYAGRAAVQIQK